MHNVLLGGGGAQTEKIQIVHIAWYYFSLEIEVKMHYTAKKISTIDDQPGEEMKEVNY